MSTDRDVLQVLSGLLHEVRSIKETVTRELQLLRDRFDRWENRTKERNTRRRREYALLKQRREEGLLPLPDKKVLQFRDRRLQPKFAEWAQVGMQFAAADQPEAFTTWLVHQWNNCTYLKKPITFSGSSFRIWNGCTRFAYGPRDLMHYSETKSFMPPLKTESDYQDFTGRPLWDWVYAVLVPVHNAMEASGFDEAPERFRRCWRLLMGGYGSYEVYTEMCWDYLETRENINRMLKRVGTDLQLMLRAVHKGLRVKDSQSPVRVPPEPSRQVVASCR